MAIRTLNQKSRREPTQSFCILNENQKPQPKGCGFLCWHYLSSRAVTRKVLSAKVCLTSVFGMGTGGPTLQSTPTLSELVAP